MKVYKASTKPALYWNMSGSHSFSWSWQLSRLVTLSGPGSSIVEHYLTSLLWRWKEQIHERVGFVPVKSKLNLADAFLLCHPLDIQKQPKIDGGFSFPTVFPMTLEFHPAGESLHSAESRRHSPGDTNDTLALTETYCSLNIQITTGNCPPHFSLKKFTIRL